MEAKIVNPNTGESMSPGEEGELWVRGPQIMKGMHIRKCKNTFFFVFCVCFL